MKLEAKDGNGDNVVKECDDEAKIKVMLKRGWKEVSSPKKSNFSKKSKK